MAATVVAQQTTTATSGGSGAATFTVNLPASVAAGDLLVVAATGFNMDNSSAAPSGWTRVSGFPNASSYYGGVFYKIAAGGETTCALAVSTPGSAAMLAVALRITGADPTTPIEASGTNNGNATPQTAPSLTPGGLERLSLVMGSWQTSSSATPAASGYTTHATASLSTGRISLASRALTSAAATGAISFNYGSGAQIFGHAHLLVRPSTAVSIAPGFIASTATLPSPAVALSQQNLTVPLLASTATVHAPRIDEGPQTFTLPAWRPGTSTGLLFDSDRTGNFELYRLVDGVVTQLTSNATYDSWWPRSSPDGSKILFTRTPAGVHDTDYTQVTTWTCDADGSNLVNILPLGVDGWALQGHPYWSPDGTKIVTMGGAVDLYTCNADGSGRALLTTTGHSFGLSDPAYSPDGASIVYAYGGQLWKVPSTGGTPVQLTSNAYTNYDPVVSPDGTTVAYLSHTSANPVADWSIRLVDFDGTDDRAVIDDGNINSRPDWSADGHTLYFHRNPPGPGESGVFSIWSIRPQGDAYRQPDPYRTSDEWRQSGSELTPIFTGATGTSEYPVALNAAPNTAVPSTRLFEPGVALDAVAIAPGHITGTALFPLSVEGADRTVDLDLLASGTVYTPGVTDGQSIDLGGSAALPAAAVVFEPTIVAGDTLITLELIATTTLWAPEAFDFEVPVPFIEPAALLWAPEPGYAIELPLIATTVVLPQLIGQYLVIPEPDEVVWGASGGFSARVDILDPGGNIVASTATATSGIVLVSGTVNEDISQAVTRECSVRLLLENTADGSRHPLLPARPGDPLDPRTGGALAIYAGPIRPSGTPAHVKLGVFRITAASPVSQATGESLTVRGLSEETVISATPFLDVYQVPAGRPITQVIGDMVAQAIPNVKMRSESTGILSPQFSFADGDNRLTKVRELANAIGMLAHFDRDGFFRVEHGPEYGDSAFVSPRWTFTEGAGAVMRDVSRELDDTELFNGVIVIGEPRDTNTAPVRAELWDSNPNSPVYYNPNNPGAGRMGPRPKKVVSPLVYTVEQARALANVLLNRLLAYPDRISVTVTANPSIEAGDLARIVRTTMGVDGLYEVQSVTHDLLGGASTAICVARA